LPLKAQDPDEICGNAFAERHPALTPRGLIEAEQNPEVLENHGRDRTFSVESFSIAPTIVGMQVGGVFSGIVMRVVSFCIYLSVKAVERSGSESFLCRGADFLRTLSG
jgi:hypothetical protein